jgi:hypothetical protein
LLIIATATLATSAPAAYADTQYGGTGLYKGRSPANPSISLVRHDDGRISGRAVAAARCAGFASSALVIRLSGRTTDGVNFTATGRTKLGRRTYRVSVTGTLAADSISATARVRTGCQRFRQPLALRSESAPAGAPAVPAPGTVMLGLTSQSAGAIRLPVSLRVTKQGRVYASWHAMMDCGPGNLPILDVTPSRRIRPDGTFGGSQSYTIRYRGRVERYRVSFSGRFLADGASGTLRARMVSREGRVRHKPCLSGQQTWSARA